MILRIFENLRSPGLPDRVKSSMDNLLLPYLKASDESERRQHLDELLIVYAAPVVLRTLRQRLGFHVNQLGVNPYNPDAEDLYHETIAKIVELLTTLHIRPTTHIENFEQYVGRITTNAYLVGTALLS